MASKRVDNMAETKMGRPKKEIKQDEFEKLCNMQCTLSEIAGFFDCSEDTIQRFCQNTYKDTFANTYKIKSAGGKISLRRTQFKLAEKSAAMAIFLGKQYLGQKDVIEQTNSNDGVMTELLEAIKNVKTTE